MGSTSIITQIIEFINELFKSLDSGYLFFGNGGDIIRYALDILIVAVLFYFIMRFIRETRAWQLIKGIILIIGVVVLCSLFGLQMVGFIFNRLLYVIAFLIIVIFQPELRRALEAVGLRTFNSFKGILFGSQKYTPSDLSTFIKEVSTACANMAKDYTGALILIEGSTHLDELLNEENVVKFDSEVSASVLESIFYKGSPMHDGGLLIRDGRIIAARCHVPLAVTMHTLERSGTRHRAAVGASEMGDTVVVVVSEEKGTMSIAVNGMLFPMEDAMELEANLSYLLGNDSAKSEKKGVFSFFRRRIAERKVRPVSATAISHPVTEKANLEQRKIVIKTKDAVGRRRSDKKIGVLGNTGLFLIALLMSFILWMYIQVNTNPVVTKTITVPISYEKSEAPRNMEVAYPIETVQLELVGRKNTMDSITVSDIYATIDYSQVTDPGVVELPIVVTSSDNKVYFRVEQQVPETISVTVYSNTEQVEE